MRHFSADNLTPKEAFLIWLCGLVLAMAAGFIIAMSMASWDSLEFGVGLVIVESLVGAVDGANFYVIASFLLLSGSIFHLSVKREEPTVAAVAGILAALTVHHAFSVISRLLSTEPATVASTFEEMSASINAIPYTIGGYVIVGLATSLVASMIIRRAKKQNMKEGTK